LPGSAFAAEGAGAIAPAPAAALIAITKRYGSVVACADVDLVLRPGEVHGILGENGAGKSTLMKILIGLVQPDSGHIVLGGEPAVIHDPQTAADLGIGMVLPTSPSTPPGSAAPPYAGLKRCVDDVVSRHTRRPRRGCCATGRRRSSVLATWHGSLRSEERLP
jgi:energy-coupling factor transporter ATP-binding protein EcfA2